MFEYFENKKQISEGKNKTTMLNEFFNVNKNEINDTNAKERSNVQKYLTNALQTKDSVKTILAQERLLEAKGTYNQFVLQLENDYPHYYQLKYDNTVSTLEEVQNELKVGTTLIEFFAGEKQLFV